MHQHVHAVLEVGHPHVPHVLNRQQIAFESACRIIPWGAALAALKLEEEHDDAVYVLVGSTKQTGPVLARWVLQLERAVIVEDEARLPREVSDRIRQFSIEDERAAMAQTAEGNLSAATAESAVAVPKANLFQLAR